jgi:hypothetical protein
VKHSSGKTDIEFENMDFLELISSEEHLLFEAVCNVSSDVPIMLFPQSFISDSFEKENFNIKMYMVTTSFMKILNFFEILKFGENFEL